MSRLFLFPAGWIFIFGYIGSCFYSAGALAQASARLADSYHFKIGITYEVSQGNKDKPKKGTEMNIWLSDEHYTGVNPGGKAAMFMIYDLKAQKMFTLMEEQKMAMVMDVQKMMEQMAGEANTNAEGESNIKISKTGKSEKILNYNCDQFLIENRENKSLVWITKELGSGFGNYIQSIAMSMQKNKGSQKNRTIPAFGEMVDGVLLKLESSDGSKGEITRLEAIAVHPEGKSINTDGYKVLSLGGF